MLSQCTSASLTEHQLCCCSLYVEGQRAPRTTPDITAGKLSKVRTSSLTWSLMLASILRSSSVWLHWEIKANPSDGWEFLSLISCWRMNYGWALLCRGVNVLNIKSGDMIGGGGYVKQRDVVCSSPCVPQCPTGEHDTSEDGGRRSLSKSEQVTRWGGRWVEEMFLVNL